MFAKWMLIPALAAMVAIPALGQAKPETATQPQVVVERQSIPSARAVERRPLTSDQFSTSSSRLIDARRGFRPYPGEYGYRYTDRVVYRDTFGIIRPDRRFAPPREARTTVRTFRAESPQPDRQAGAEARVMRVQIVDERDADRAPRPEREAAVDMTVRIHQDTSALPTHSGAVIIRADGTVIQVGD